MSLFTKALDDHATGKQYGENGHIEYSWNATSLQERICQLNFQCVRNADLSILNEKFSSILHDIKAKLDRDISSEEARQYLVILMKLVAQLRDIEEGKGERDITYMMIVSLYDYFPILSTLMVTHLISLGTNEIPYGSWKDMKYLCYYIQKTSNNSDHPLIRQCISMICEQIKKDLEIAEDSPEKISLCARWVPRETSSPKFSWLFKKIAFEFYPEFMNTANSVESRKKATNKTFMTFARRLSYLNRKIDTVQIKMCGRTWAEIDHNKTTSVTLSKNKKAFLNKSNNKAAKYKEDRITCANNFEEYIESRISTGKAIKGKNVALVDYVKQGLLNSIGIDNEIINAQWSDFMTKVGDIGNMVAMVDQSGSMACYDGGDPYYAAIGLGVAIAEKSALGPRIMTFASNPRWISLENVGSFSSKIQIIEKHDGLSGTGTDFFKALNLILDSCIIANLPNDIVSNMVLVILSDMQINEADRSFMNELSMQEKIDAKYRAAGYDKSPHILFWNLRSTSGFPTVSTTKNCSMLSGFSPVLLNVFCQKGIDVLSSMSPWNLLVDSLSNMRYNIIDIECRQFFDENIRSTHD